MGLPQKVKPNLLHAMRRFLKSMKSIKTKLPELHFGVWEMEIAG